MMRYQTENDGPLHFFAIHHGRMIVGRQAQIESG
jgi:hypothetical protein|tara:strand:+ start:1235 stop:1336 length:102 start_codon:yes stop_codon:yes gene_type:complete